MKEVEQEGLTSVPPIVEDLRSAAKDIPTLQELCWLEQKSGNPIVWAVFGDYNKDDLVAFFNIEFDLRRQAMRQGTPLGEIQVLISDLIAPKIMREITPQGAERIAIHQGPL